MAVASLVVKVSAQIAELQKGFNDATKTINQFQTNTLSAAKSVATAFGVGLSLTALTNFTKSVVDSASEIVDLSNKLGISTDAVQKLNFIAGQTGTTIEAFGKAIFTLGNAVAGGDKSAAAALEKLGISFADLKKLKPEDQFDKVIIALSKVTDAQERNAIATKLFGSKVAQEIAKAIAEYEKLGKIAPIAGRAQIEALDEAGDAFARFQSQAKRAAIDVFGSLVLAAEKSERAIFPLIDAWREQQIALLNNTATAHTYADALERLRKEQEKTAKAPQSLAPAAPAIFQQSGKFPTLPAPDMKALEDEWKAQDAALRKVLQAQEAYRESVKALRNELSGAKLQGDVKQLSEAFNGLTAEEHKNNEVLNRVGEAAARLRSEGAKLTPTLNVLADQTERFKEEAESSKTAIEDLDDRIGDLSQTLDDELSRALKEIIADFESVEARVDAVTPSLDEIDDAMQSMRDDVARVADLSDAFDEWGRHAAETAGKLHDVANILRDIGSFGDGTFSKLANEASVLVDDIANIVSATNEWSAAMGVLKLAFDVGRAALNLFRDEAAEAANDIVRDFLGTFRDPNIATGQGEPFWEGLFHRLNQGATLLRERMKELGDQADVLWDRLNNARTPAAAQKAIDAINNALANTPSALAAAAGFQTQAELQQIADKARKVYEYIRDSGLYTADQIAKAFQQARDAQIAALDDTARAAIDSNQRVVDSLKSQITDLQREHDSIFSSWLAEDLAPEFDEQGNRIFGVVEQQQRARLDQIEAEKKAAEEALKEANQNLDDSFNALGPLAQTAAADIVAAFADVEIHIPVHFDVDRLSFDTGSGIKVPALGSGAVVRRPTLALVGESGPEVVAPLSELSNIGSGGDMNITFEVDGYMLAKQTVPYIPGAVKRYIGR